MKLLVTAFEPFNGSDINPSQLVLEALTPPPGVTLAKELLPVEFRRTFRLLPELLERHLPDAVLSLGQAGNRPEISVELVAINLDSVLSSGGAVRIADNAGDTPIDQPIVHGGENAYFSTLPVREMVTAICRAGVSGAVSFSAGTFVCNHVMYTVLHEARIYHPAMKAGFIHVPFLPGQMEGRTRGFAMELEEMTKGVQAAVQCIADELS